MQTLIVLVLAATLTPASSRPSPHTRSARRSCSRELEFNTIRITAQLGWPLVIDCKHMEDAYISHQLARPARFQRLRRTSTNKCVIVDAENEKKIFLKTYRSDELVGRNDQAFYSIDKFRSDTPTSYKISLEVTNRGGWKSCMWANVEVKAEQHEEPVCGNGSSDDKTYQLSVGAAKRLDCFGSMDADVRLSLLPASVRDRLNIRWFHNCDGEVTSDDVINDGRHVDLQHALVLKGARFEHAGSYVCAAEYDGMTKFFNKWNICITPGTIQIPPRPMPRCPPPVIRARLGQLDFSVQLNVSLGQVAVVDEMWYEDEWKKDDMECGMFALPGIKTFSSTELRIQCMQKVIERQKCFSHVASESERNPIDSVIQTELYFDEIREKDFGSYTYRMKYYGAVNQESTRCHFTIEPNPI